MGGNKWSNILKPFKVVKRVKDDGLVFQVEGYLEQI